MQAEMVREFRLYWLTGKEEVVSGPDLGDQKETLANAMSCAGIGNGALRALDYWEEIRETEEAINAS